MANDFKDRRNEMFGRIGDIAALVNRTHDKGITSVVARPKMGKTWTLIETARRLENELECIVGYHESKGAESSHLLYAVSDLYTRWLSDSTNLEQARSIWENNRPNLIPRVGKLVGTLFKELGGVSGGIGTLVSKATGWAAVSGAGVATGTATAFCFPDAAVGPGLTVRSRAGKTAVCADAATVFHQSTRTSGHFA